eukprot:6339779-Amphidinium_carterae.1
MQFVRTLGYLNVYTDSEAKRLEELKPDLPRGGISMIKKALNQHIQQSYQFLLRTSVQFVFRSKATITYHQNLKYFGFRIKATIT